jgi:lipopolysaccharide export LptBFGC system permease protein LptF
MSFRNTRGFRVDYDVQSEQYYVRIHDQNKKYFKGVNFKRIIDKRIRIIDSFKENILIEYNTLSSTAEERIERKYNYVRVKDSSTGKFVFLSVPNHLKECKEAIAWTFGLSLPQYNLFFQT